jgi:hypothetical protein
VVGRTIYDGLAELRERTGAPDKLRGECEVDQAYAHAQHEHLDWRHPRGGGANYLRGPLMDRYRSYLMAIAATWTDDGGRRQMELAMEHLSDQVEITAPVEFWDLRRSGHPVVRLGGRVIYDRPPKQRRLTRNELRAKARLRPMPPQLLGWIWWHVMKQRKPPPRRGRR